MLLTQYHLMKNESVLTKKMMMHFQQGVVSIEKIAEQDYQLKVTLANQYQEEQVLNIAQKKSAP
ncbi:hypothetical protein [Isobaculum melis]|uniref:hypothetical protein n=1 Tax=Isobaculum melis TaxID=142588 RepID=UPI00115F7BCB|nr:hypothetical protein [Isobaculum melis]